MLEYLLFGLCGVPALLQYCVLPLLSSAIATPSPPPLFILYTVRLAITYTVCPWKCLTASRLGR